MELIVGTKQSGKSSKLIKYAHKNDLQIVCQDKRACENMEALANKLNMKIRYPLTYGDLLAQNYYGYNLRGLVIDNAEKLLQALSPNLNIFAVTFNIEDSDE